LCKDPRSKKTENDLIMMINWWRADCSAGSRKSKVMKETFALPAFPNEMLFQARLSKELLRRKKKRKFLFPLHRLPASSASFKGEI